LKREKNRNAEPPSTRRAFGELSRAEDAARKIHATGSPLQLRTGTPATPRCLTAGQLLPVDLGEGLKRGTAEIGHPERNEIEALSAVATTDLFGVFVTVG
jgi:hypothetical protein